MKNEALTLTEEELKCLTQICSSMYYEHYYQLRDNDAFFNLNKKAWDALLGEKEDK